MHPDDITKAHMNYCEAIAWRMCYGDHYLGEDIASELYVKILESGIAEFAEIAPKLRSWAIDFLRSRRYNYSYGGKFQHISFERLIETGIQIDMQGNSY